VNLKCFCDACGLSFVNSSLIGGDGITGTVKLRGNAVQCPRCGRMARVLDGTYNFVGESAKAFRGASYEQLEQLRAVAKAAAEGVINAHEAKERAEEIDGAFGSIIAFTIKWGVPSLLIAFLNLYIAWAALKSSDKSSDQMLAALNRIEVTMQQLYEKESTSRRTTAESQTYSTQALPSIHTPPPSRTPSGPNRKQRRRDAALTRKPTS